MAQKIIEVVGVSTESFDKAADNAIQEAGRTVRNIKWARVQDFEMAIEGSRVLQYRATVRIFFDVDH